MSTAVDLVFNDAVPPEFPPDDDAPDFTAGPEDAKPDSDSLACEVCGKALVYAGRGRKPKFCEEHRKAGGGGGSTRKNTGNERLANQATESLVQLNRLTGLGFRLLGLPESANMIDYCEEGFRLQAYQALLTDPALCKQLLAVGGMSGKTALIIAYAMMGAQVAPVAYTETRLRVAERKLRKESEAAS